jgi:hypothetical protein
MLASTFRKSKTLEQRFKSLLCGDQEARRLLAKAQALTALHSHFICVAPPYLAQSSQVLGLKSGTLSIAVANATIAAKLRQLAPELTVLLQNRGCEVSGIRVKVQVSFEVSPPVSAPRKLESGARNVLNEFSQTLNDSPLKRALKKMISLKK